MPSKSVLCLLSQKFVTFCHQRGRHHQTSVPRQFGLRQDSHVLHTCSTMLQKHERSAPEDRGKQKQLTLISQLEGYRIDQTFDNRLIVC